MDSQKNVLNVKRACHKIMTSRNWIVDIFKAITTSHKHIADIFKSITTSRIIIMTIRIIIVTIRNYIYG